MYEESELILSESFDNEALASLPKPPSHYKFVHSIVNNIGKTYEPGDYNFTDFNFKQSFSDFMCSSSHNKRQPKNIIKRNLIKRYKELKEKTNTEVIDKLIYNERAHIVSVFNDCRIYNDHKENLIKYAIVQESLFYLPRFLFQPIIYRPFRFHWKEYCFIKRNNESKERIYKMLNEKKARVSYNSNLFDTDYRNCLVEDDLSNSLNAMVEEDKEMNKGDLLKLLTELNDDLTNVKIDEAPNITPKEKDEPKRNGSLGRSEGTATDSRSEGKLILERPINKRPLLPPTRSAKVNLNKIRMMDYEEPVKTMPSTSKHSMTKWISQPKGDTKKSRTKSSQKVIRKH